MEFLEVEVNLFEVSFDQGPFGHETKKPTRLGTNLGLLRELHGVRGPGTGVQDAFKKVGSLGPAVKAQNPGGGGRRVQGASCQEAL